MSTKITILVENYALNTTLAEWGFSALIEHRDKCILFDVGQTGYGLINNAKELGVDLKTIDGIVLSHGHYDHCDGLEILLKHIDKDIALYAHPEIFRNRFSKKENGLNYTGMKISESELQKKYRVESNLHRDYHQISDGICLTGEIPFTNKIERISSHFKMIDGEGEHLDDFPDDNSLVIETEKGPVIIFGCAHRGVMNTIDYVKMRSGKKIYGIIGGTHLYSARDSHFKSVVNYLKREDIELLAPGHCTGIDRIFDLKQIFKNKVKPAFSGQTFFL